MIYLGADHAGYKLKEKIKKYLEKHNISYADLGAHNLENDDDYVGYATMVSKKVSKDSKARGILLCGSGNGMAIAANKHKNIRAAVVWSTATAKKAVEDDHANIIALPARYINSWRIIKTIKSYLAAKPSKVARHIRRVKEIQKLEK